MEKKVVTQAVRGQQPRGNAEQIIRLLDFVVSKDGVFRTSERWAWDAARPLIRDGVLSHDGETISAGVKFEEFLVEHSKDSDDLKTILSKYRSYIADRIQEYNLSNDKVMSHLQTLSSVDDKIIYLTSVVSQTFAKLDHMIEKTQLLEATLSEMDTALSVMETVTFDENSDR